VRAGNQCLHNDKTGQAKPNKHRGLQRCLEISTSGPVPADAQHFGNSEWCDHFLKQHQQ
jgi:hypothetical protein